MDIIEEEQELFSTPRLNFAWPADELIVRSLAGYADDYSPQVVLDYYHALRARNFVILAGPAEVDKAGLAQALAEVLVGQNCVQGNLFRAHPSWAFQLSQVPLARAFARYSTARLFDLVEMAATGQEAGLPFFAAVEQASPADVSHYFEDLPRGLIRRLDGVHLRIDLPRNLYVTGLLDVEDGVPLDLSPLVLKHAAVIRLRGSRFPWSRQRQLFLQPEEEGAYALAG